LTTLETRSPPAVPREWAWVRRFRFSRASSQLLSVAVDGSGNVYFTEVDGNAIQEMLAVNGSVPASPTIKTVASGFGTVAIMTQDGSGNLYIADDLLFRRM